MSKPDTVSGQGRGRVAIAGAGVIGLACGFELASRGYQVALFDPANPGDSASWAAAGMIGPAFEMMKHGTGPLSDLCFESAALWPGFAGRLREASGRPVGYDPAATLSIARTVAEADARSGLAEALRVHDNSPPWLSPLEVQSRFHLSGRIEAVLELPSDAQVDNRRLLPALRAAIASQGGAFLQKGVETRADIEATLGYVPDAIIWARGRRELGVCTGVKGQALSLASFPGAPHRVIRFGSSYVVPKPDRIVIGATSEEAFSHAGVSPAVARSLLEEAIAILPALAGAKQLESWAGVRPKSKDGTPIIGSLKDNEFVAAAHHRNGILLAPVTAARIADLVEGNAGPEGAFSPHRLQASHN